MLPYFNKLSILNKELPFDTFGNSPFHCLFIF
nr:MAG TPA: hypothetical protein [Caudoviricetes sp.]